MPTCRVSSVSPFLRTIQKARGVMRGRQGPLEVCRWSGGRNCPWSVTGLAPAPSPAPAWSLMGSAHGSPGPSGPGGWESGPGWAAPPAQPSSRRPC